MWSPDVLYQDEIPLLFSGTVTHKKKETRAICS